MINKDAVFAVNKFKDYMNSPCSLEKRKERDGLYSIIVAEHEHQIKSITMPVIDATLICQPTWKEILFLWYIAGKPVSNPRIGIYWYLEMKVFDYQDLINRLASSGFLETNRISNSLINLSLDQLRTIAKENNFPTSGTKAKLADKISRNISAEKIDDDYSNFATFSLTQKGKKLIEESESLIFYHRNKNRKLCF